MPDRAAAASGRRRRTPCGRRSSATALDAGAPAAPLLVGLRERLTDDLDSPGAIALVDAWARETLAGDGDLEDEAPRIVCDAVDALLGVALGDCG